VPKVSKIFPRSFRSFRLYDLRLFSLMRKSRDNFSAVGKIKKATRLSVTMAAAILGR
jgi:hypothetical protein